MDKYIIFGSAQHSCMRSEVATFGLTAVLRCFARLPNLRRSSGAQGTLKWTTMPPVRVYMQDWSNYLPWPTSTLPYKEIANGIAMKLQYDAWPIGGSSHSSVALSNLLSINLNVPIYCTLAIEYVVLHFQVEHLNIARYMSWK
jgi:hypothetical protein